MVTGILEEREIDRKTIDSFEEKIKTRIEGSMGGVMDLLKILDNASNVVTEKVLEVLKKASPDSFKTVRAQIILFADIMALKPEEISKVLMKVKIPDIGLVAQPMDESSREQLFKNLPEDSVKAVKEWLELSGKQSAEAIENAKRKFSSIAKKLEQSGEITVNRG